MKPTVLMGDPTHFSVVGGANPHTRDRWGRRKSVDRTRAIRQWHALRDLLTDPGLHRRVSEVACRRVREQYCVDRVVPLYEDYYRTVLER